MAEIVRDKWGNAELAERRWPDWELGLEHIAQEGSSEWRAIRERKGLSPEDVESVSASEVMWEEVRMCEDRPGIPELAQLAWYARLQDTSPGALLDAICERVGREVRDVDPKEGLPTVLEAAHRMASTYAALEMRGDPRLDELHQAFADLRGALARAGVALDD